MTTRYVVTDADGHVLADEDSMTAAWIEAGLGLAGVDTLTPYDDRTHHVVDGRLVPKVTEGGRSE